MELPIPSSSDSFPLPQSAFNFHHDPFFYYIKLEEEEKRKKRESERSFNRTLDLYKKLQNTQFDHARRISSKISNSCILFDSTNTPKAYKIYKCQKCFMPTLQCFFDFQKIYLVNKFIHSCCYSNYQQQQYYIDNINNDDPQLSMTLKFYVLLLSTIICLSLKVENKLLKMTVFSDDLVTNPLILYIFFGFLDKIGNKKEEENYPRNWLLELVNNEEFTDLGEIKSSHHWTRRAYSSSSYDVNYSTIAEGKVTELEEEEIKQFIFMTGGTFGFIKFKIDTTKQYMHLVIYNLLIKR
jgi:hypothetical protein